MPKDKDGIDRSDVKLLLNLMMFSYARSDWDGSLKEASVTLTHREWRDIVAGAFLIAQKMMERDESSIAGFILVINELLKQLDWAKDLHLPDKLTKWLADARTDGLSKVGRMMDEHKTEQ